MSASRIVRLRGEAVVDWTRVGLELAARLTGLAHESAQLLRIDDGAALLVVTATDDVALGRIDRHAIAPWLEDAALVRDGDAIEAELAWRSDMSSTAAIGDAERLAAFVRGVRASGSIWGLRKQTWARSGAGNGREALPLWPDEPSAVRCIGGEWTGFRAHPIALVDFVEEWLPAMAEDGLVAVVMPTSDHDGAVVLPEALLSALLTEPPQE